MADALEGRAVPGDVNGTIDVDLHNSTNSEVIMAKSPFTSWTRELSIARANALKKGPNGIILRVETGAPGPEDTWSWEYPLDIYMEQEVALRGVREGCCVLKTATAGTPALRKAKSIAV